MGAMGQGDFSIGSGVWPGISKLIEECAEVGQVAGKLIGSAGAEDHWDGTNLRSRLIEEIGDAVAAMKFVADKNGLDEVAIAARAEMKLALFNQWHDGGPDRCLACGEALKADDQVMADVSGENIHAACCGPERESYVKDVGTGESLGPNDPLPTGFRWGDRK